MATKTIFLASGNRMKKTEWAGSSFEQLEALHKKVFYEDEGRKVPEIKLTRQSFYLRDREFGVAFEGFALDEVMHGSVLEVRDEVLEGEAEVSCTEARLLQEELDCGPPSYFAADEGMKPGGSSLKVLPLEDEGSGESSRPPALQQQSSLAWAKKMMDHAPKKTFKERLWDLLDDPGSSRGAFSVTVFLLVLIIFSTITFCMETLPVFYEHEPTATSVWYILEATCIGIFTIEFFLRVASTPSLKDYFNDTMNQIDVVAIMPFYLEAILANVQIPGLAVFRVVRLVRVFRLFKVSRGSIVVFANTMRKSAKPLYMLVFFTTIAMIIFSSLVYYVERGVYNEEMRMWMRVYLYYCETLADATVGPLVKHPDNYTLPSGMDEPCKWIDPSTYDASVNYPAEALFTCPYTYMRHRSCIKVYEQSPFESIPTSFWWCLVTMTTVGYGDVAPSQPMGKVLGGLVMIFGIVVIALPITVIGSNFATIYKKMVLQEKISDDDDDDGDAADDGHDEEDDDDEDHASGLAPVAPA